MFENGSFNFASVMSGVLFLFRSITLSDFDFHKLKDTHEAHENKRLSKIKEFTVFWWRRRILKEEKKILCQDEQFWPIWY